MKRTHTKKEGPRLITTVEELTLLVESKERAKVVLGGDLVLASLTSHVTGLDYVKQPMRNARRTGLFDRGTRTPLHVWLDKEAVVLMAKAGSRIQASLAIDHYLRWGLKQQEQEFILFGGDAGQDKSILLVMHFKKGVLINLGEKSLPGVASARFLSEVYPLLEHSHNEVPGVQVYWAAPLPEVRMPFVTHISDEILMGRTGFVVSGSSKATFLTQHGLGIGLIALGLVGYAMGAGIPYLQYKRAAETFDAESTQLKGEFQFAADRLKLLQERQLYLRVAAQNAAKMGEFEVLLSVAAEQKYPLQDATLRLKKTVKPGDRPIFDVELNLEQPKVENMTAIEQASPVISTLSSRMQTPLHLAPAQGYTEVEVQKGKFKRVYKIEGDLHATKAN